MRTVSKWFLATLFLAISLRAFASASLDPNGSAVVSTHSSGSTATISGLSTTNSNDVIIINSGLQASTSVANTSIVSISGGGLTWARHGSTCTVLSSGVEETNENWYAVASSPLSAVSITITYTSGSSYGEQVVAFAVSGANTTTPFDTNSGIPGCQAPSTSSSSLTNVTTTNQANDFIFVEANYKASPVSCPSGYTALYSPSYFCASYSVVSGTLSSASLTSSVSGSVLGSMLVDAIQPAGGGSSCTHTGFATDGTKSIPNGTSGTYMLYGGTKGTPDCSTIKFCNTAGPCAVN